MDLLFERGDRNRPVGHALVYFRADDGRILAAYVIVPPIKFDLTKMVPEFLAGALQGMDFGFGGDVMATPIPPIPEEVPSRAFLEALAESRQDDLVYAGGVVSSPQQPIILMQEMQEAVQKYGELFSARTDLPTEEEPSAPESAPAASRFTEMTERERLDEMTMLTGRLRDSLANGRPDQALQDEIEQLAGHLPAKYRSQALVRAALTPGENGQRLAQLYLERSYKLFNEDYLDLERIDREIDALER